MIAQIAFFIGVFFARHYANKLDIIIWESVVENRTVTYSVKCFDKLRSSSLSLNPRLHYGKIKLFVNLHVIFESMNGTLWCNNLNETSLAGFAWYYLQGSYRVLNWVIPDKIHTPTTEGMLENLTGGGGGVNGPGN